MPITEYDFWRKKRRPQAALPAATQPIGIELEGDSRDLGNIVEVVDDPGTTLLELSGRVALTDPPKMATFARRMVGLDMLCHASSLTSYKSQKSDSDASIVTGKGLLTLPDFDIRTTPKVFLLVADSTRGARPRGQN